MTSGADSRSLPTCVDADSDARLYLRTHHGEAKLSSLGHLLIENRHGLIDARATQADGYAERETGLWMLHAQETRSPARRRTVGPTKGMTTTPSSALRDLGFTPHVVQNPMRRGGSAIDDRTIRHDGYAKSHPRARGSRPFAAVRL
jgi:hypothetical protein